MWQAAGDPVESASLRLRQIVLDEEIAMFKEIGDFLLHPLALTYGVFGRGGGRPAPLHLGFAFGQGFSHWGHRMQERLGEFLEDMEFANLVRHFAEDCLHGLGIQGRPIGGHALHGEPTLAQGLVESAPECLKVLLPRIVIEHLVEKSFERAIVHDE